MYSSPSRASPSSSPTLTSTSTSTSATATAAAASDDDQFIRRFDVLKYEAQQAAMPTLFPKDITPICQLCPPLALSTSSADPLFSTYYCYECALWLCVACSRRHHARRIMQEHVLIPVTLQLQIERDARKHQGRTKKERVMMAYASAIKGYTWQFQHSDPATSTVAWIDYTLSIQSRLEQHFAKQSTDIKITPQLFVKHDSLVSTQYLQHCTYGTSVKLVRRMRQLAPERERTDKPAHTSSAALQTPSKLTIPQHNNYSLLLSPLPTIIVPSDDTTAPSTDSHANANANASRPTTSSSSSSSSAAASNNTSSSSSSVPGLNLPASTAADVPILTSKPALSRRGSMDVRLMHSYETMQRVEWRSFYNSVDKTIKDDEAYPLFDLERGNLLCLLTYWCQTNLVQSLLSDHGYTLTSTTSQSKLSILQLAVMRGHVELAQYLIEKGADVQYRNRTNNMLIEYAIQTNLIEMVSLIFHRRPANGLFSAIDVEYENEKKSKKRRSWLDIADETAQATSSAAATTTNSPEAVNTLLANLNKSSSVDPFKSDRDHKLFPHLMFVLLTSIPQHKSSSTSVLLFLLDQMFERATTISPKPVWELAHYFEWTLLCLQGIHHDFLTLMVERYEYYSQVLDKIDIVNLDFYESATTKQFNNSVPAYHLFLSHLLLECVLLPASEEVSSSDNPLAVHAIATYLLSQGASTNYVYVDADGVQENMLFRGIKEQRMEYIEWCVENGCDDEQPLTVQPSDEPITWQDYMSSILEYDAAQQSLIEEAVTIGRKNRHAHATKLTKAIEDATPAALPLGTATTHHRHSNVTHGHAASAAAPSSFLAPIVLQTIVAYVYGSHALHPGATIVHDEVVEPSKHHVDNELSQSQMIGDDNQDANDEQNENEIENVNDDLNDADDASPSDVNASDGGDEEYGNGNENQVAVDDELQENINPADLEIDQSDP